MFIIINFKLIAREWKKMSLIAFVATFFLFFASGIMTDDIIVNIFGFIFMFIGLFIGVNIFWSAGSSISGLVSALKLKRDLKNESQSGNLPPKKN